MSKPRIAVSLLTADQDFQAMQASDATTAADRAGFELAIVFAKNNSFLQVEQLYRFIHAPQSTRPIAILVQTVAADALPRLAREAAVAGIGWILLNRDVAYVDDLRAEYSQLPIGIVTTDQIGIGRIQGRQMRTLLPRGGSALYIQGPPEASTARERLQGMQEAILNAGIDLRILNGEWTEASGEKAVTSWLRLSSSHEYPLALISAQNDAMALGARKAIASGHPDWLNRPFTGCDGLAEGGQRLVTEGLLAATVVIQPSAAQRSTLWRLTCAQVPYPPVSSSHRGHTRLWHEQLRGRSRERCPLIRCSRGMTQLLPS